MQTSLQQLQREEIMSITYVAAGANANVLTKEESDKQEREDCDFTGGDKDKDHEDVGQVGTTEKSKEILPTTDVAHRSDPEPKVIAGRAETPRLNNWVAGRPEIPHLNNWVGSWREKLLLHSSHTCFVWVNVYGYYHKKTKCGGYGVILRDVVATPVAAAAKCSKGESSFFSQVLEGVNAGILLANKHRPSAPIRVICNSDDISLVTECWNPACRSTSITCDMCNLEDCNVSLVRLRRTMIGMERKGQIICLDWFPTVANKAAKYIAKMGEMNKARAENKEERSIPGDEDLGQINPGDFPKGLQVILWKDAFRTEFYRRTKVSGTS